MKRRNTLLDNKKRIVGGIEVAASLKGVEMKHYTRGHGSVFARSNLVFPNDGRVSIDIRLEQWPTSAERIAGEEPLTTNRRDHAAGILVSHILRIRDELNGLLGPFWREAEEAIQTAGNASRQAAFERLLVKLLRRSVADEPLCSAQQAADLLNNVLPHLIPRVRQDLDAEEARQGFRAASGVDNYVGLFPVARQMRRTLVLNVGPTNSGKTHRAMEALRAADNGCYLAPLRLMALEGYDRLIAAGVACDLSTGEETIHTPGAQHVSSTIEMANTSLVVDVGIVDEVQMLADPSRGWAWTRAVVGLPARTLFMTGSPDAIPFVERIAAMCGDTLVINHHTRLSPLASLSKSVRYSEIQPGDAIVAFSRSSVFSIRETLRALDISCAMIYGALGPEVRRAEANRFREGTASVLVATDAIGMGLNLPIRRVLLAETEKFDGKVRRQLTGSEVRQICGRAGRYDPTNPQTGTAGVLVGNDHKLVRYHLSESAEPPADTRLYASPHWEMIRDAAALHGTDDLLFLLKWCGGLFVGHDFQSRDLTDVLTVAGALRGHLPLQQRFEYLGCPVDGRSDEDLRILRQWATLHERNQPIAAPKGFEGIVPDSQAGLQRLEQSAKQVSMYLWLSMRWPDLYSEREAALDARSTLSVGIETCLRSKALSRLCTGCDKALPPGHRFPICDECHG